MCLPIHIHMHAYTHTIGFVFVGPLPQVYVIGNVWRADILFHVVLSIENTFPKAKPPARTIHRWRHATAKPRVSSPWSLLTDNCRYPCIPETVESSWRSRNSSGAISATSDVPYSLPTGMELEYQRFVIWGYSRVSVDDVLQWSSLIESQRHVLW